MCPTTEAVHRPHTLCDFSLVFPPDPGWVRTARDAVGTALRAAERGDLADTALLLTSEVVTNAVNACRNGGCSQPVTLYGEWPVPARLRVLVHDGAPGLPVRRRAAGDTADGRGLFLVEALADEWGVCRHGPGRGKSVWFELGE
ncbi:ATP-binding protein [Streptomyces albofaciens JCM 4342]|uniref:ATP-binding protein n=1 Tax=Streptomyces albofaciens TaxID=66866 RepID=UPI0012388EA3|nr:ATP-binding protein [Streptomyces albofaciens]KAA6214701.1 ATP-binding protein [Streptomyces albofaciens JCM 4342]